MADNSADGTERIRAIDRWKYPILLAWAVLAALGAAHARAFIAGGCICFAMPRAAEGFESAAAFSRAFPDESVKVIALVERVDGDPVLGEDLRVLIELLGNWSAEVGGQPVASYYGFADADLQLLAAPFVSDWRQPNQSIASIAQMSLPTDASRSADALAAELAALVRAHAPHSLSVRLVGEPYFLRAALDGVKRDVETVHPKVLPFALIPFGWIVRSWRLGLITLVCIGATVGTSFLCVFLMQRHAPVTSLAPPMMLSAALATSIDYSLFLLSRFREELPAEQDLRARPGRVQLALDLALTYAGQTVVVSGTTLALCFFGLLAVPVSQISSLGLAAGITITVSIGASLSLLPALILTLPAFFSGGGCDTTGGCGTCFAREGPPAAGEPSPDARLPSPATAQRIVRAHEGGTRRDAGANGVYAAEGDHQRSQSQLQPGPVDASVMLAVAKRRAPVGSCWARVSTLSIRHSLLLLCLFVALTVPCAYEAANIQISAAQQETMPRDAEVALAYDSLIRLFGAGSLLPFQLLIEPRDGVVASADFFSRAQLLVRRVLGLAGVAQLFNASGVMLSGSIDVPFALVQPALSGDEARCAKLALLLGKPVCAYAVAEWQHFTNGEPPLGANSTGRDATATYVTLAPLFDPFSDQGRRVLARLREAIGRLEAEAAAEGPPADTVGLAGGAIAMLDSVSLVYRSFPLMVTYTLTAVFALLGFAFQSLVVPARAVLTVSMSIALTLGVAWLVYGEGALDPLGLPAVARQGTLSWSAPVLALPVMVGLGLDYDVFLLG
jgi:uncharacterized membrane protein YdfJ with MMPL/SSD domain